MYIGMTILPVPNEPGRYLVTSETDGAPWLVDLSPGDDLPGCGCAIEHNRTEADWDCKHLRAVKEWLQTHPARANVRLCLPRKKPAAKLPPNLARAPSPCATPLPSP